MNHTNKNSLTKHRQSININPSNGLVEIISDPKITRLSINSSTFRMDEYYAGKMFRKFTQELGNFNSPGFLSNYKITEKSFDSIDEDIRINDSMIKKVSKTFNNIKNETDAKPMETVEDNYFEEKRRPTNENLKFHIDENNKLQDDKLSENDININLETNQDNNLNTQTDSENTSNKQTANIKLQIINKEKNESNEAKKSTKLKNNKVKKKVAWNENIVVTELESWKKLTKKMTFNGKNSSLCPMCLIF